VLVEKTINNAVASVKMEGYNIDEECIIWCKQLLNNEIDMKQYISLVKQKAGVKN